MNRLSTLCVIQLTMAAVASNGHAHRKRAHSTGDQRPAKRVSFGPSVIADIPRDRVSYVPSSRTRTTTETLPDGSALIELRVPASISAEIERANSMNGVRKHPPAWKFACDAVCCMGLQLAELEWFVRILQLIGCHVPERYASPAHYKRCLISQYVADPPADLDLDDAYLASTYVPQVHIQNPAWLTEAGAAHILEPLGDRPAASMGRMRSSSACTSKLTWDMIRKNENVVMAIYTQEVHILTTILDNGILCLAYSQKWYKDAHACNFSPLTACITGAYATILVQTTTDRVLNMHADTGASGVQMQQHTQQSSYYSKHICNLAANLTYTQAHMEIGRVLSDASIVSAVSTNDCRTIDQAPHDYFAADSITAARAIRLHDIVAAFELVCANVAVLIQLLHDGACGDHVRAAYMQVAHSADPELILRSLTCPVSMQTLVAAAVWTGRIGAVCADHGWSTSTQPYGHQYRPSAATTTTTQYATQRVLSTSIIRDHVVAVWPYLLRAALRWAAHIAERDAADTTGSKSATDKTRHRTQKTLSEMRDQTRPWCCKITACVVRELCTVALSGKAGEANGRFALGCVLAGLPSCCQDVARQATGTFGHLFNGSKENKRPPISVCMETCIEFRMWVDGYRQQTRTHATTTLASTSSISLSCFSTVGDANVVPARGVHSPELYFWEMLTTLIRPDVWCAPTRSCMPQPEFVSERSSAAVLCVFDLGRKRYPGNIVSDTTLPHTVCGALDADTWERVCLRTVSMRRPSRRSAMYNSAQMRTTRTGSFIGVDELQECMLMSVCSKDRIRRFTVSSEYALLSGRGMSTSKQELTQILTQGLSVLTDKCVSAQVRLIMDMEATVSAKLVLAEAVRTATPCVYVSAHTCSETLDATEDEWKSLQLDSSDEIANLFPAWVCVVLVSV